jgi:2-polyprenyl-3-methyl-5-hydroxy-6-metoxy-1,4-benzoquinol methylase
MDVVHGNTFDKYASTNPIVKKIMAGFIRNLDMALDCTGNPGSVLEIGAGDGSLTNKLRARYPEDLSMIALDPGFKVLQSGRIRYPEVTFLNGSIYDLPFPADSFDLVMLPEVLEHLEDPESGLVESIRVSSRFLIISVPWEPVWRISNIVTGRYLGSWGNTPGHIQHWSRQSIVQFVRQHVRIIKVFRPFPWTMIVAVKS